MNRKNTGSVHVNHFTLNACKEILHNVTDYTFAKSLLAIIACTWVYIFGSGQVLFPIFLLVLLDTITGVMKAMKAKKVSSSGYSRVAMKFFIYLILIATAGILDREFSGEFALTGMKTFLMATEAISIMENIGALGWPVPTKLLKYLKDFSGDSDKNSH